MILSLDHLIFGNGFGLGSPYFDARYYWLVDTRGGERDGRKGRLYGWIGGLGAQLKSFQWRHPLPGERRRLGGREFTPFNSTRRWLRVEVSWAMVDLPKDLDQAHATIRGFKSGLGEYR